MLAFRFRAWAVQNLNKMKDLFKVTVKIGKKKQVELLFDDQNRAERFINATTQIMTQKTYLD